MAERKALTGSAAKGLSSNSTCSICYANPQQIEALIRSVVDLLSKQVEFEL